MLNLNCAHFHPVVSEIGGCTFKSLPQSPAAAAASSSGVAGGTAAASGWHMGLSAAVKMSTEVPSAVNGVNGAEEEEEQDGFVAFEALHTAALQASGLPQTYWRSLFHKITNEVCPSPGLCPFCTNDTCCF